ncbi:MAG: hypothetical protein V1831_00685, partial [Candidatus Woesearchaeota archaeon]
MPDKSEAQRMKELVESYKMRIEKELGTTTYQPKVTSREYQEFKKELLPKHLNLYEKLCNSSEKILKIKVDEKKANNLTENINIAHLDVTPS